MQTVNKTRWARVHNPCPQVCTYSLSVDPRIPHHNAPTGQTYLRHMDARLETIPPAANNHDTPVTTPLLQGCGLLYHWLGHAMSHVNQKEMITTIFDTSWSFSQTVKKKLRESLRRNSVKKNTCFAIYEKLTILTCAFLVCAVFIHLFLHKFPRLSTKFQFLPGQLV